MGSSPPRQSKIPQVDTPTPPPKTPFKSKTDGSEEVKIFHFYYRGSQQDLKIYVGTPVELIWRTLFQQLGILQSGASNFEKLVDNVSLLDSDGCPVVFSPEHIPHNEKLYVQFNISVQSQKESLEAAKDKNLEKSSSEDKIPSTSSDKESQSIEDKSEDNSLDSEGQEFSWDTKWNSLYCGYTLKDNDQTITCGTPIASGSMPILISNRTFKKGTGVYKWRVVFKEEMTYHAAGIVSSEEVAFPRKCANFGNNFPSVPWFYKTAPMGVKNTTIILDTNNSKVTVNGKTIEGVPDIVYAGICFKMPHKMEGRLLFD